MSDCTFRVFVSLFDAVKQDKAPPERLAWFVVHGCGAPRRFKRLVGVAARVLRGEQAVRIDFAIQEIARLESAPVTGSRVGYARKASSVSVSFPST